MAIVLSTPDSEGNRKQLIAQVDESTESSRIDARAWVEVKPAEPRIKRKFRLNCESRGILEPKRAVQLPQGIDPQTTAMCEEIVAFGLSLRPVPNVMNSEYPEWAHHPHQNAKPDEQTLESLWALESPVYEPPVHPDRMTKQESGIAERREYGQPAP